MDEQQDQDARREAEALRRDREKAERLARREEEKARKDREKAARDAERDEARRRQDTERRERDLAKAEQSILRERDRAEQELVKEAERRKAERERAARDAAREAGRALREAEKAARAAALAQQKAAREAENARRQALRADQDGVPSGAEPAAPVADLTRLPADIAVLWRTPEPARRGPRPGLTLEQIADAAIALADAEGIGAVSMARLAESLGFTTMSLYRYVASKDEVLALMTDRAGGRAPSVGPEVGDWRARLELLVALSQPVLRAHPWMAQTSSVLHSLGPNRLTWMEAMLAALDEVPLSEVDKLQAVGALSSHMLEELRMVDAITERARETTTDEVAATGDVIRLLADPDSHPALLRAVDGGAFDVSPLSADEESLGFGTVLLLDGIERLIERASSRPQLTAGATGTPDDAEAADVSDGAGTLTS